MAPPLPSPHAQPPTSTDCMPQLQVSHRFPNPACTPSTKPMSKCQMPRVPTTLGDIWQPSKLEVSKITCSNDAVEHLLHRSSRLIVRTDVRNEPLLCSCSCCFRISRNASAVARRAMSNDGLALALARSWCICARQAFWRSWHMTITLRLEPL